MKKFFYGIIIGITDIIPGLSAPTVLISFDLYEYLINNISKMTKNPIKSLKNIFSLISGILIGIFIFSNIINSSLKKYNHITKIIFILLVIISIYPIIKKIKYKKIYIPYLLISFLLGLSITTIKFNKTIILAPNIISFLLTGIIISISSIIPGISKTIILNIFGLYKIYIHSISTLNIKILFPIFISFVITTILLTKILTKTIKNYNNEFLYSTIGITISTIPILLIN